MNAYHSAHLPKLATGRRSPTIQQFFYSLISFVVVQVCVTTCFAAVFQVELKDNDGPHVFATVNTTTDSMTINTWTEIAGNFEYWTPSDLPRVYPAINSVGGTYDVPDNWDGTIDSNWGFVNPDKLPVAGWTEGSYAALALVHDGWGGRIDAGGNVSVGFDETTLQSVPWAVGNASPADLDFISVVEIIPEPTTLTLAALALLPLGWSRRRKQT